MENLADFVILALALTKWKTVFHIHDLRSIADELKNSGEFLLFELPRHSPLRAKSKDLLSHLSLNI